MPEENNGGMKLNEAQIRKLIGGAIGSLCQMADVGDVRAAVEWWAGNRVAWTVLEKMGERGGKIDQLTDATIEEVRNEIGRGKDR